jgi:hypothetical protein
VLKEKSRKNNVSISLELPYQCPADPSLKFYTTLACDTKREGDQKKQNKLLSKRCENCNGPVLIKKSKKENAKPRTFVRV